MSKQYSQTAKLTPASEFRRLSKDGFVVTLQSSGRVVRLRSVQLMRMLNTGNIPDPLTSYVASIVYGGDEEDTRSNAEKSNDWQSYLDLVVTAALMHPTVVDDPQGEDEIAIEYLEYAELVEIYGYARNPLDAVRPFVANKAQLWTLGQKAEKASRLPSECVPGLEEEIGEWGVYCFDNAVGFFIRVMENALQERDKVGDSYQPKYTLSQLLKNDYHLPRPQSRKQTGDRLKAMFGSRKKGKQSGSGVRLPQTIMEQLLAKGWQL